MHNDNKPNSTVTDGREQITLRRDISGFTVRWNEQLATQARATGEWPGRTVAEWARQRYLEHPERIQLVDDGQALSCRALYEAAQALAGYFVEVGLAPGNVVSFQLPNWWEANVINLACAMCGLVVNPIVPINRDAEVTHILNSSGSRMLFIPEQFRKFNYREMLERISPELTGQVQVILVRSAAELSNSFERLLQHSPPLAEPLPVDPDAVKLLMYTSGTTGRPKGVLHSHNTVHADGMKMAPALGLTSADCTFSPSPITHVSGYLWVLNMPWLADIPAVTIDTWNAERALHLLKQHRCSFMLGATPFLRDLVNAARQQNESLPALRQYLCGGAAVPPTLIYEAADTFENCIPWRNFGATEAMTMTRGPSSRLDLKMGAETDGRLHQCQVKIVDLVTGEPVPPGEEGEILVKEASMALGYANPEDNLGAYDEDGFFRMGDIGRIVFGDHVLVTGRKKDIIIRSGENISAKEIEDALLTCDDILDAAVVSKPSPVTGEAICAFLVARGQHSFNLEQVTRVIAAAGLARQKTPEHIIMLSALPKTASGKVRKDQLRLIAAQPELSAIQQETVS